MPILKISHFPYKQKMTLLSLFRTKPRKHEHAERSVLAPVATAAFLGGGLLVAGLYRNYKTRKLITTLRSNVG